ncbi:alpha/beta fold hydrolase [Glycomyces harbinensis]|uniref:Pimeloyl-ACP methyl ester carboxylesterase n=1 Tax=Glycomyces harbinensis TaxID=58114 RepID=A0A1G6XP46_9ACTN|nr:alpha/beta hydrolase [Glycomyces harbinensis]SDD79792.1 Pimeloyl-ACP methyl ester carboxylesterase [Glycomyces harbinensis]
MLRSLYKSHADREVIARWCRTRLDAWDVPHRRETVALDDAIVHLTYAGTGSTRVVFVPGTNFNAAAGLTLARALARRWGVVLVDLPGQPGLSSGERPHAAHRGWYGSKLAEVLEVTGAEQVVALGHSLGGSVVLSCDSDRIAGRVLLAPAGIIPLHVDMRMMVPSLHWLLAPSEERTASMLEDFTAPATPVPDSIVEWLHLVAVHCRSTLAPPPLPEAILHRRLGSPLIIATGAHDCFLPPERLAPATRAKLGTELHTINGAGHLAADERPGAVTALVDLMVAELDAR